MTHLQKRIKIPLMWHDPGTLPACIVFWDMESVHGTFHCWWSQWPLLDTCWPQPVRWCGQWGLPSHIGAIGSLGLPQGHTTTVGCLQATIYIQSVLRYSLHIVISQRSRPIRILMNFTESISGMLKDLKTFTSDVIIYNTIQYNIIQKQYTRSKFIYYDQICTQY